MAVRVEAENQHTKNASTSQVAGLIDSVPFQFVERRELDRRHVRRRQDNLRSDACFVGFFPTKSTQAPTITGLQARKRVHWIWCRQVVASCPGKLQKFRGHYAADQMQPNVLGAGSTTTIPIETRHWLRTTRLDICPENIFWNTSSGTCVFALILTTAGRRMLRQLLRLMD